MVEFFVFVKNMLSSIFSLLDYVVFNFGNFEVSFIQIIFGFIFISIIISAFWKGASG